MCTFYTDKTLAISIVKQQIKSSDTTHDLFISQMLDASKAKESYRPFIVASFFMKVFPPRGGIIQATGTDGVTWIDPSKIVSGLIDMQAALDVGCYTEIPIGWESKQAEKTILGFTGLVG